MKTSIVTVAGKKNLVIDTEIAKAAYREGITDLSVVLDAKTGEEFSVKIDMDAPVGDVSKFGATVNGIENDNLAVVIPVRSDDKVEDIKKKYGSKLVAAQKAIDKLGTTMDEQATAVDANFAGVGEALTKD